jgi:uncharacterized membrane protein YeiH
VLVAVPSVLEWVGVGAFALTGAVAAARHRMDPFGFVLLAIVTGVGGGTLRDLMLGVAPVFWVRDPAQVLVCILIGLATFVAGRRGIRLLSSDLRRLILWTDSLGLALFAVTGAARALEAGASSIVAIALGTMTATFGGIIRDLLCAETPIVLRSEIYVTAAAFGAGVQALGLLALSPTLAMVTGFVAAFGLRSLALVRGWSLPRFPSDD